MAEKISTDPVLQVECCDTAYDGYLQVIRYHLRHLLFNGCYSKPIVREVVNRGQVVAVLPLVPQLDRLILLKQFRPGAYAAGWHPWLLECVAGIIDTGENAEQAAYRETKEETGCTIQRLELMGRCITSPGACSETVTLYAAQIDTDIDESIHGLVDENEDILVRSYGINEALALLEKGRIVNAKTVIAMQWLSLHYTALKQRWTA